MRRRRSIAPMVGVSLAVAALLVGGLAVAARKRPEEALPPAEPIGPPEPLGPVEPAATAPKAVTGPSAAEPTSDTAEDDETALARMLASEDPRRELRIVVGWITAQRALRSGRGLFDFLTRGKGYGPFYEWVVKDGKKVRRSTGRHASTAAAPSAEARRVARGILDGRLLPSAAIMAHVPGSWVERFVTLSDEDIIAKQGTQKGGFSEGIYGQIEGTNWVMFSRDTPPISIAPFNDATARLNALPKIKAVSPGVA